MEMIFVFERGLDLRVLKFPAKRSEVDTNGAEVLHGANAQEGEHHVNVYSLYLKMEWKLNFRCMIHLSYLKINWTKFLGI